MYISRNIPQLIRLFKPSSARFNFGLFALIAACILGACSATFNWRIVRADDLAYEALYPAKPNRAQRTLVIDGVSYTMTMEAAKAQDTVFAVGTIELGKDEGNGDKILSWLKENTSKSLGSDINVEALSNISFSVAGSQGLVMPATGIKISGKGPDQLMKELQVRWVRRIDGAGVERIYQVTTLQSFEKQIEDNQLNLLKEHIETFYAGFHPY